MTSTVSSLAPAHNVIEIVHTGAVSANDMREASRQVLARHADASDLHVLSDFSAATELPGAIALLDFAEKVRERVGGAGFRQAFVWPAEAQARLELDVLRTGEQNRGLAAEAFGDRESALAWLES